MNSFYSRPAKSRAFGSHSGTIVLLVALLTITGLLASDASAKSGKIIGNIVDSETGQPLIGASVYIKDTKMGAATDLDGNYVINRVPPGQYIVIVSSIGYDQVTVEEVLIAEGESFPLNVTMQPKQLEGEKIVVKAKALQNTEANLLRQRQKSITVSDAISAEAISRAGSSDAADAMTKVTGASVVGGKFVYIRGLGGRYGNARLNGTMIPTPDPEQQSVPMDLFPTNLLDNVVIEKTFTPDKPGNFSGGSVDLRTKDLPDALTLSLSASASYNENATFNSNFLSAPRGSRDWLAYDDGMRDIPTPLENDETNIPTLTEAINDIDSALALEDLTRAFTSTMKPIKREAPLNQSYAFSFGNSYILGDRPLSLLTSLTYNHSYSYYDDGKAGRWTLSGGNASVLSKDYLLDDYKGTEEVLWGGLLSLNYPVHQNHKFSTRYIYNRQGKHEARFLVGEVPKDAIVGDQWFEHRAIQYKAQTVGSLQLEGEHYLKPLRLDWKAALTESTRNEPDLRNFSDDVNQFVEDIDPETGDTTYSYAYYVSQNYYSLPIRFYRDIKESNREGQLDINFPITKMNGQDLKLSFGTSYLRLKREVAETKFLFQNSATAIQLRGDSTNPDEADPNSYFGDDVVGFIDSTQSGYPPRWHYNIGTVVIRSLDPRNNYDGQQEVFALYGMYNMRILPDLNFVGGVRYETTEMSISDALVDTAEINLGLIDEDNWLPSVSLTYNPIENMNFRLAYGRTLARPTIRELSPMMTQDFDKGFIFIGNPDLVHTLIDNYDLRWEWFTGPGEILAVSGYYKRFRDPIERTIISNNFEVKYKNVPRASVYGVELEIRESLGLLAAPLRNFSIEGNLTLTKSKVNIGDYELNIRRHFDSTASATRELQGQSSYLLNLNLSYSSYNSGTSAALLYNVFGDRLSEVSEGGTPDVYERSRPQLDFTLSQKILGGLTFKISAKNLLDSKVRKTIEYKGVEYIFQEYSKGRSFSFGLSYKI
jgi:TonB-dependent receptor